MGEINVPRNEQDALDAIDSSTLSSFIDECLRDGYPYALQPMGLDSCGPFVASNLRRFEGALSEYRQSKAPKKLAATRTEALLAGSDLLAAVQQMKARVETEKRQAELFYIDDHIQPPFRFTEQLTVKVHYRWRPTTENEWAHERIEFLHRFDPRPNYLYPQPTRKGSAAQQARDRQDELHAEWEHLRRQALWSVRDYFQGGGDGSAIPRAFQAKADTHTRGLNNFSARFWT
jgi:hypothetical protein